ncbi:MAG: polysaccharide deacetylase family protein [Christensenellaceae bacterium]
MAVFCHSMHHARYVDLSRAEMQADAEQAKAAVEAFFGRECHYIRPPYGAYTKEVAEAMEEIGMRVLLWNRDSEDWREDASAEDILENALHAVAPGDILLFQTNAAQTAPALEVLLPTLRRMGYEFAQIKN